MAETKVHITDKSARLNPDSTNAQRFLEDACTRAQRNSRAARPSLNTLEAYLTRLVTAYKRTYDFQVLESVVIKVREVYPIYYDLLCF